MERTFLGAFMMVAALSGCSSNAERTDVRGESPVAEKATEPARQLTISSTEAPSENADKVKALIDQLAAINPKPQGFRDLGKHEPQIWNAVDQLHNLGTVAFPFLIEHFDDDRYCCSEDHMSDSRGYPVVRRSVGSVCRTLIGDQVRVCIPWDGDQRGTPGYNVSIVPHGKNEALEWWLLNQDKALWELQSDNVRLVIDMNRQRLRTENSPEYTALCEKAIRANEQLELELKQNKKPITREPWRPYIGR